MIEFEKIVKGFHPDMIMFGMGLKGIFNLQIEDIIKGYDSGNFDENISTMKENFKSELEYWNNVESNPPWMKDFKNSLKKSMNCLFKYSSNYFDIIELGKYKSLEIYTFFSNQFINSKKSKKEISSIIDADNASVLPYVEVYTIEKTIGLWLIMTQDKFGNLKDKETIKIGSLFGK